MGLGGGGCTRHCTHACAWIHIREEVFVPVFSGVCVVPKMTLICRDAHIFKHLHFTEIIIATSCAEVTLKVVPNICMIDFFVCLENSVTKGDFSGVSFLS